MKPEDLWPLEMNPMESMGKNYQPGMPGTLPGMN